MLNHRKKHVKAAGIEFRTLDVAFISMIDQDLLNEGRPGIGHSLCKSYTPAVSEPKSLNPKLQTPKP